MTASYFSTGYWGIFPYVWNLTAGLTFPAAASGCTLADATPTAINYDGAFIVGHDFMNTHSHNFFWRPGSLTGCEGADPDDYYADITADGRYAADQSTYGIRRDLTNGESIDSLYAFDAYGISDDGNFVVGSNRGDEFDSAVAVYISELISPTLVSGWALRTSSDGEVVAGLGIDDTTLFRWTPNLGIEVIEGLRQRFYTIYPYYRDLDRPHSIGLSGNGDVITGEDWSGRPSYWTAEFGVRSLAEVLQQDYGLDLSSWTINSIADISYSGRVFLVEGEFDGRPGLILARLGQAVSIDWDSVAPYDAVRVWHPFGTTDVYTDCRRTSNWPHLSVCAPVPPPSVSDSFKSAVEEEVRAIFARSGVENIFVTNRPVTEGVHVFMTSANPLPGWALWGLAATGVDPFNRRLSADVIASVVPQSSVSTAEVIAHEIGHTMGLRHVDPDHYMDEFDEEVMDTDFSPIPRFTNCISPSSYGHSCTITDPGDPRFHNPLYHLLHYTDSLPESVLTERNVLPGSADVDPAAPASGLAPVSDRQTSAAQPHPNAFNLSASFDEEVDLDYVWVVGETPEGHGTLITLTSESGHGIFRDWQGHPWHFLPPSVRSVRIFAARKLPDSFDPINIVAVRDGSEAPSEVLDVDLGGTPFTLIGFHRNDVGQVFSAEIGRGRIDFASLADVDRDLVPDAADNCPGAYNPNQWDDDWDHVGDVCDPAVSCGRIANHLHPRGFSAAPIFAVALILAHRKRRRRQARAA